MGKLDTAVSAALADLDKQKFGQRLWDRDPSLWKTEPEHQQIIRNALGWLTVPQTTLAELRHVLRFVEEVRSTGFKRAVLLGMGGSSLCPEVCRATFGAAPGYLELQVLDSTVPASVARVEKSVDLSRTIFLVSSKSGETTETLSFFRYFFSRVQNLKADRAGENFVAITDPETSLEKLAREKNFRRVFHGQPDIGGRFSALSHFGVVPAALAGVDVRALLASAERMVSACGGHIPARDNPGVSLGVRLAEAARAGYDKVTFFISPGIKTFGDWVEQLIAESTGKEGQGIVPVISEIIGAPAVYGSDRLFINIQLAGEARERFDRKLDSLVKAGHSVIRLALESKLDLGGEFFRWEVATATAGALLGINPFDQPNVQESKDNTHHLLDQHRSQGKLDRDSPVAETKGLNFCCDSVTRAALEKSCEAGGAPLKSVADYFAAFVSQAQPGDYLALLAFLQPSSRRTALLQAVRMRLRDGLRVATTLGYGPRYLHSTGQLHKGGPNKGLFILLTADDATDLPVPDEPYSFSVLKQAQALGDFRSFESKQRRVARVHLGADVNAGLDELLKVVDTAVATAGQPTTSSGSY